MVTHVTADELKTHYGFDFYQNLTEEEKNDPSINILDPDHQLTLICGKDFNLNSIKLNTHAPKSTLYNVYEYRGAKPSRRVIRLLSC